MCRNAGTAYGGNLVGVNIGDGPFPASRAQTDLRTDGAFRIDGARRWGHFRDGLASTVIVAEVIAGRQDDWASNMTYDGRGTWAFHPMGAFCYTHLNSPNTTVGDATYSQSPTGSVCHHQPPMLPCDYTGLTDFKRHHAAARSRHPGGIQVLFGDGHVTYVTDTVDLAVWRDAARLAKDGVTRLD